MGRWVNPRVLGALCLLGIALLISGLFLPWVIRINYLANAHCPNGPGCPPPMTDSRSYWESATGDMTPFSPSWWVNIALSMGPLLLVLLLQLAVALAALRGYRNRSLIVIGLICALVVLALYLLATRIIYCLFYAGCGAIGPFATPGERILAPGFWLLLGGFLVSVGSDLALLLRAGRPSRRGAKAGRDGRAR